MRRLIWLGSIALLCSPLTVWSQEAGSRIRITESEAAGFRRHSGTLVRAGADTIVLKLDRGGEAVAYPLAGVSRFEVSQGQKGHALAGAGLGLLAGAGLGALIGATNCGSACSGSDDLGGLAVLIWSGIGAGVGLVAGGVIGSTLKSDRWEEVPSSRWRVSVSPAGSGGFRLGLAMQF
jgi:hypothetical protein